MYLHIMWTATLSLFVHTYLEEVWFHWSNLQSHLFLATGSLVIVLDYAVVSWFVIRSLILQRVFMLCSSSISNSICFHVRVCIPYIAENDFLYAPPKLELWWPLFTIHVISFIGCYCFKCINCHFIIFSWSIWLFLQCLHLHRQTVNRRSTAFLLPH